MAPIFSGKEGGEMDVGAYMRNVTGLPNALLFLLSRNPQDLLNLPTVHSQC